jgi:hypothetical protein
MLHNGNGHSVWLVTWSDEFNILFSHRAYSYRTSSNTRIYRSVSRSSAWFKTITDYLWILLAAAGIILIAPWSNNGIDLLGVVFALLAGALWAAYIVLGGKVSKIMKGGEAVATGMLFAALLILPFEF